MRGKAYFEPFSLEEFFLDLFQEEILNKKLSDLQIEALLFYTDLYTLEARVAEKSDAVSRALFHSCRFPFVFSGYKSDNTAVDGGLAINLPVDELKRDESTKGGVIGITFRNEFRSNARGGLLGTRSNCSRQPFNTASAGLRRFSAKTTYLRSTRKSGHSISTWP